MCSLFTFLKFRATFSGVRFLFCTYTPVILVLERLRQEDPEFETSLASARAILVNSVPSHPGLPKRSLLKKTKTNKQKHKINIQHSTSNTRPLGIMGSLIFIKSNDPRHPGLCTWALFPLCRSTAWATCSSEYIPSSCNLWCLGSDPASIHGLGSGSWAETSSSS